MGLGLFCHAGFWRLVAEHDRRGAAGIIFLKTFCKASFLWGGNGGKTKQSVENYPRASWNSRLFSKNQGFKSSKR